MIQQANSIKSRTSNQGCRGKRFFLMLCDAPSVSPGRGMTHNTPNMKWISNVGNDATQQVPKLIAANESKNEPWRLIVIVALWKMEWYKSKLEKLEQKLQIDEISEVNNSARESVREASTNTKEFIHNFIWLLISNLRAVIKIQSLDGLLWVFFLSCQYWAFHLPPVFMSQNAKTITFGLRPDNQYFPLTACPSLAFISLHDMAASIGVEPRGTGNKKIAQTVIGKIPWENHIFWSEPCQ